MGTADPTKSPAPEPRVPGHDSVLLQLIELVNRADAAEEIYQPALDALTRALDLDGAIVLAPEAGPWQAWQVRAQRGLTDATARALEQHAADSWPSAGGDVEPEPLGQLCDRPPPSALAQPLADAGSVSAGCFPLWHRKRLLGSLVLLSRRMRCLDPHELRLAGTVAAQIAQAIARATLFESERRARAAAERYADRMRRLARVASALSSALTARDVADVIVEETAAAIGADTGGVWLLNADKTQLEMLGGRGPAEVRARILSYPVHADNPLCLAVRSGEPVWIESWAEFAARFPASEQRMRAVPPPRPTAFGCYPLRLEDQTIGGLAFSFFGDTQMRDEDRAFIGLLAQHCAHGMERARLYERALDAIRVRDDFLSVAGHELRTPLATLLLQTQHLIGTPEDVPGGKVSDRSAPVLRTLRRLIKLADEVMDISRIRAGRLRLEPEPLELTALVRDVATRTVEALRAPRPQLHFAGDGPIVGRWDPLRIEQIVTNLITNAGKYGGGKPIEIRVARGPDTAEIVVRDQGIGIAVDEQARIFERFERVVEPSQFAGLGLGLWIAREIVQAHGGQISVRSELGQGAEFTVLLPFGASN